MNDDNEIVGRIPPTPIQFSKRSFTIFLAALGVMIVAMSIPSMVSLLVDWYWYQAVQFESVFVARLSTKLLLGLTVGVFSGAFFYINLWYAQRGVVPEPMLVSLNPQAPKTDISKAMKRMTLPISLVMAFLVGLSASNAWLTLLRYYHRTEFGITDPVYGRDIGYYIFTLPAVSGFVGIVVALALISLFMTLPIYAMRKDILIVKNGVTIEPSAGTHIALLIATMFVATAANIWFVRLPALLYSETGPLFGASFTDLSIRGPALRVSAGIAITGALLVLFGAKKGKLARFTFIALALYVVGSGAGTALLPAAVQKFVVVPNELMKEKAQIGYHIAATQHAWGLDEVITRDITGEASLDLADIQANSGTIDNVRLWDRGPILQTFGQLQEIRTYYDFISVDDDRYWIDGQYRQVLLSPRELNTQSLPTRTFVNERLTFTHGMGLTLSPVNQVTEEGLPVLFIKNLPPSSVVSLKVTRPGIYYGELSSDYVFVNTKQAEFDYPADSGNATTVYDGTGGVLINSFFRRLILAIELRSKDLLFSSLITSDSKVLFHRNIAARAARALPFLTWDSDPYMVIADDGKLKWILDAYTSTNRYPYSQPLSNGINYMRNSVKVVIDAYDGSIDAYVVAPEPIQQTYAKIFPDIFQPLESMPEDLRKHIRYPEDLFRAQTGLYTIFHMEEPEIFYHREDQWQIPVLARGEGQRERFLRHIIMKLPGEEKEEFIVMTPFTPRQKDNLAAWMVARSDGEQYGQLVVYRFPRQSLVFGPAQIVNRINQNTDISRQVSLWDQRGSEVIRGNLLVIPIEESLIFVQALYLRAEGGRIPELKRVIVAYRNQVVMEETLGEALSVLFGGRVETDAAIRQQLDDAEPVTTATRESLAEQLQTHYTAAVAAQRSGDWAIYGQEIQEVGRLIRALRDQN